MPGWRLRSPSRAGLICDDPTPPWARLAGSAQVQAGVSKRLVWSGLLDEDSHRVTVRRCTRTENVSEPRGIVYRPVHQYAPAQSSVHAAAVRLAGRGRVLPWRAYDLSQSEWALSFSPGPASGFSCCGILSSVTRFVSSPARGHTRGRTGFGNFLWQFCRIATNPGKLWPRLSVASQGARLARTPTACG
jgi:hypothetical protein